MTRGDIAERAVAPRAMAGPLVLMGLIGLRAPGGAGLEAIAASHKSKRKCMKVLVYESAV
jgi:hypothetical protein